MSYRIIRFSAVALGLPLAVACSSHSSTQPKAEPPPAGSQAAAVALQPAPAAPCGSSAQAAPAPTAQAAPASTPKVAHAAIAKGAHTPIAKGTRAPIAKGTRAPIAKGAHPPIAEALLAPMAATPLVPVAAAARIHHLHGLDCPMDVPGTVAAYADIHGRASIDFETTSDVVALRHRVRAFLGPQQPAGIVEAGVSADTQGAGGTQMRPDISYVAVRVRFSDLPTGVRATFIPADDGQAASVHAQIAAQVAKLDRGDCSDMHIHGVKMKDIDRP